MWKNIIRKKSANKRLNFKLIKEITLEKSKEMKGKTLNNEEYMQFQEVIRQVYSTQHPNITLDRIKNTITRMLKQNDLLEIKRKHRIPEYDANGKLLGTRSRNFYHFI